MKFEVSHKVIILADFTEHWLNPQSFYDGPKKSKDYFHILLIFSFTADFQLRLISLLFSQQFDFPMGFAVQFLKFLIFSLFCANHSTAPTFACSPLPHTHTSSRPPTAEKWIARHGGTASLFFFIESLYLPHPHLSQQINTNLTDQHV